MEISSISGALEARGLFLCGAFHPKPGDGVPALSGGGAAATLVLAGNQGPDLWRAFRAEPESGDGTPDPLDRWTARVVGELARALGCQPVFPFDRPHPPFMAWAKRAGPAKNSPLGILIHPDFGLWQAYRAALLFAQAIDLPPPDQRPRPCDSCPDRPCLEACPVGAFDGTRYDGTACAGHMGAPAGGDCLTGGCLARRACPVGRSFAYGPGQAGFHMAAFLGARGLPAVAS
jgi:hypothetical protein